MDAALLTEILDDRCEHSVKRRDDMFCQITRQLSPVMMGNGLTLRKCQLLDVVSV